MLSSLVEPCIRVGKKIIILEGKTTMETWTQEIQAGTAHKIQADDSQTLANKVLTLPEISHNY